MKESISRVFDLLRNLQVQPTETNVTILAECMLRLRDIYNALPDEKPQDEEPEIQTELEDEQAGEE